MKRLITILLSAITALSAQTVGVFKSTATATKNQVTEDLIFPAARSLTLSGVLQGTPTGGVLDLHNLTITLPSNFVTTSYLGSWVGSSNLTTGAGGLFGTAAYTSASAYVPAYSGLTTNGLIQATGATSVASTLTPSGLTSIGVATITAPAVTNLVLNGGSSGASITLGQGTRGNVLFTPGSGGSILFGGSIGAGTGATAPVTEWQVNAVSASAERGIMASQYSADIGAAQFIGRKGRGSFGAPGGISSGDAVASLIGEAYDGSSYLQMGAVTIRSAGTIGTGRIPTQIEFWTATDVSTSVLTKAMYIDSTQALVGNSSGLTLKSGGTFNNITLNTQNGYVAISDATLTNSNVQLNVGIQNTTSNQSFISSSSAATAGFVVSTGAINSPLYFQPQGVGEMHLRFNGSDAIYIVGNGGTGIRFPGYGTGMAAIGASGQITSVARTINGTTFDGTGNITVTAAAGTLTGSTLNSGVTGSSLTSVGVLSGLATSGALNLGNSGASSIAFDNSLTVGPLGGTAFAQSIRTTISSTANNDILFSLQLSPTLGTSTSTGLTYRAVNIANPSVTGSGTIDNMYGIYVVSQTRATNNYALFGAGVGMVKLADTTDATASAASIFTSGGITATKSILSTTGHYFLAQSAPANPGTSGEWVLYSDSGDTNKLKAKASTGTVVTLGTP